MKFILNMQCDNAAFYGDPNPEIARILRVAADCVENQRPGFDQIILRDTNGNRVGFASVEI